MFTSAASLERRGFVALAIAFAASGCARDRAPRAPGEAATHGAPATVHPCLHEDSIGSGRDTLVFSDVRVASETLDASGTEVSLWRRDGRWAGELREANGELGDPRPLRSVTLDPATAAISLSDLTPGGHLSPFTGTFACSRIEGTWSLFGGTTTARVALARVPHSGFQVRPASTDTHAVPGRTQEFWSEFRRAALTGDYKKIEGWTRFPLAVHGARGFGTRPGEGFDEFFTGVMGSAVATRGTPSGTMRTLLERTEQISPEQSSPDGDAFRVGVLQFDLIDGRWQLTSVDFAS